MHEEVRGEERREEERRAALAVRRSCAGLDFCAR